MIYQQLFRDKGLSSLEGIAMLFCILMVQEELIVFILFQQLVKKHKNRARQVSEGNLQRTS